MRGRKGFVRFVLAGVALLSIFSVVTGGRITWAATSQNFASGATYSGPAGWVPVPPGDPAVQVSGPPDAQCAAAGNQPGGQWIQMTFPAFAIPLSHTINGVEARVKYLTVGSQAVQLTSGGVLVGATRTVPAHYAEASCDHTGWESAGGPSDTWGLSLSPADFNAGSIGFRLTQTPMTFPSGDPGSATIDIDAAELVVYHSPPNSPPTAEAGGSYTVTEGGSVVLSGAGSSDPEQSSASLSYEWDLDNNGSFETSGINPTFSAAGLDGPSSKTVRLRVTDSGGLFATDTAAVNIVNGLPSLTVNNAAVNVNEGNSATNSGTFSDPGSDTVTITASVGTISQGLGSWTWSFDTSDGPSDSQTVTVTATDDDGASTSRTFSLIVHNVPPAIQSVAVSGPINEGESATVTVGATDPAGNKDPLTYAFDCDNNGTFEVGPQAGNTASCLFGDDGNFPVRVRVADDDGGVTEGSAVAAVLNVAPTAVLSTADVIAFPGEDAFFGRKDVEQAHSASANDPGSDDLAFGWDFEVSTFTTTYFNDTGTPSGTPDPVLSPGGNFPFAASSTATVTFTAPGLFLVTVKVTDDDGGSTSDAVPKLVTDNQDCARSQGFWRHQFLGKNPHIDAATLQAYLDMVDLASAVFSERVPASTPAEAAAVFDPKKGSGSNMLAKAAQQALAAWLNFVSGAVDLNEEIDADGDGTPETPFLVLIGDVETILLNPSATHADLVVAKDWAEAVNLRDEEDPVCQ